MGEHAAAETPGARPAATTSASDTASTLATLLAGGAQRFDPVRFRVIEALARRAADRQGSAGPVLDRQLARLLAAFGDRFERARIDADETLAGALARHPAAAVGLRRCHAGGDFKGLRRLAAELDAPDAAGPLADLLRHIDHAGSASAAPPAPGGASTQGGASAGPALGAGAGPLAELKAVRYFRSSWARLSVDRQLSRSMARAPEQAGPLNSQLLVLRSLQRMRDVSPAYLGCFMAYVDTLMWLEQAGSASPAAPAAARGEADKKRKPGRGRAG